MIRIISSADESSRNECLSCLQGRSVGLDAELMTVVSEIVDQVRKRGDEALIEYSARFDNVELDASQLRVSVDTLRQRAQGVDSEFLQAVRKAITNVSDFHARQKEDSWNLSSEDGINLGQRIRPIDTVGLYVPGGTAAYPSSVVMNVVPAQVA